VRGGGVDGIEVAVASSSPSRSEGEGREGLYELVLDASLGFVLASQDSRRARTAG
jgi:hypothetical protein